MARNGNLELASALALLIRNQAQFVAHLDEDRQRFSRIERDLEVIKALLLKHEEMMQKLAEAIRDNADFADFFRLSTSSVCGAQRA
jgi:hypothetical protein